MKQTKHNRKSDAQNLCSECPAFTRTHAFKRLRHCAIAAVMTVWSSSLYLLPQQMDVLSTPSYHGSANGRPCLEGYLRCYTPPDLNLANSVATSLEGQNLASLSVSLQHSDCVTCTVNCMISVTSTLRHQVRDVGLHGTQRSKFTSMINIHLQSCVLKIIKIRAYL